MALKSKFPLISSSDQKLTLNPASMYQSDKAGTNPLYRMSPLPKSSTAVPATPPTAAKPLPVTNTTKTYRPNLLKLLPSKFPLLKHPRTHPYNIHLLAPFRKTRTATSTPQPPTRTSSLSTASIPPLPTMTSPTPPVPAPRPNPTVQTSPPSPSAA